MPRKKSAAKKAREALRRETETQPSNVASSTLPRKRTLEFESDGEVDEPEDFKINTEYAKRFHHNKEREEIHRLQEKYKDVDLDEEDSSTSEEEDDYGELLTEKVDQGIENVLRTIRNEPEKLLNKDIKFFGDPEKDVEELARGKQKPVYLKDYHRMALLGEINDENDEKPFAIQQEEDRKKLVAEMHADSDEDGDNFLTVRKEERKIDAVELPDPEKDEKAFLDAFVNSKAWLPSNVDKKTGKEIAPSYGQIVEDDDEFDDIADTFETAYNFRFEDPNANEIVGYARNQSTLRRNEENSRKRARDKKKEAKRAEEEKRKAEITKLKKHKVQQVMSRLEKLKEAIGDPDAAEALSAMDLDGEFDDTEWDRKMRNVFNDEFYAKVDSTDKPEFSDVGDDLDGDQDHDTEDAQGVPAEQSRAKSKKVERLKKKKDRDELRAKAEEFVEENLDLALDEANMADPIKSTFKYREVEPESFGLTARDILLASDKDLNAYAGLKAYAPYRDSSKKEKDKKKFAKKRRLREWRKAVFNSEDAPDDEAVREYLKKAAEDGSRKHKKAKKQKH